jgi:coenzyme F420-reducing hydrogenase gamma subunit
MRPKKLKVGFFSFSCCEGCQFTILFLDNFIEIMNKFDIQYFHLLKEKNRNAKFDLAFVEGAITSKDQIKKLKIIREKSKFVVAIGACACHGGIPSMRNFIENEQLEKYVYNQEMLKNAVKAAGIGNYIKVDYYMYGCPIIKDEFVNFVDNFIKGKTIKEFEGPVCSECPRRGKNCYLKEKIVCLGAVSRGGCNALCVRENVPCVLCRGPSPSANLSSEINLFKTWGLSEKDIINKISKFKNIDV